jgi:hypothetical protein
MRVEIKSNIDSNSSIKIIKVGSNSSKKYQMLQLLAEAWPWPRNPDADNLQPFLFRFGF